MTSTRADRDDVPAGPHAVSWSDPRTGVAEEAAFLGQNRARLLAFLHRPAGAPLGGMVLCSSLYQDLEVNYRSELLVARALAARGVATVRFHYRGTGNSDDVPGGAVTFDSMLADAHAALTWLVDRTGVTVPLACGFRLGALVAAAVAAGNSGTPLVLWAPAVSGAEYFRGLSRANRVAGVRAEARTGQVGDGAERPPAQEDAVEMLGNLVYRVTQDDLRGRVLPPDLGRGRRILLVHVGLAEVTSQYEAFVSGWRDGEALVDVLNVRTRQLWMLPDVWEPVENSPTTRELVDGITGWAVRVASERS